jgi:hypothetical protein
VAISSELRVKHRRAPGTPGCSRPQLRCRRRRSRLHNPSCLRGRGRWLGCDPQHQTGDAGGLSRQCQLAAGDEIELPRFAPDFQHHGADRIADERIGRRPQRRVDVGPAHAHQPPRIEAEFAEPAHRQRTGFDFRKILAHPHQRTPSRQPSRQAGDETGRGATLASLGKHFMHRTDGETTAQHRIGAGMAERHPVEGMGLARRLEAFDAPSQIRKRVCACAAHAPLLENNWTPLVVLNEPAAGSFVHDMF